jgi:O-antigen ligase
MENGEDGDVRQEIWKCGLDLVEDHELIGYGNDGYKIELYQEYIEHGLMGSFKGKLNLHNQYLESLVATGAIGLIVFLIMVIIPAILALTRKYWNPVMVVFTILYASWLFFEEGFSRQMGLLFICWWYCALLTFAKHYPSPKVSLPLTHKRKAIKGKEIHS